MFDRNLLLNRETNHWKIQSILLQCYFFVVQTLRVLTTHFHGKNIYFLFNIFKPLWEIVFKKKKSCGQSISLCMYSSFCLTGVKWVRLKGEVEGVKFSGNGIAHTRSLLRSVWILQTPDTHCCCINAIRQDRIVVRGFNCHNDSASAGKTVYLMSSQSSCNVWPLICSLEGQMIKC